MNCELCKINITSSQSYCYKCKFPLQGDPQAKSAFRMKLVDIKFWLKNMEQVRNLTVKFGALLAIVGLLLLVIKFQYFFLVGFNFLMGGAIYLAIFFWSKKDFYTPFLVLPIFYSTHTLWELANGFLPYDLLPIGIEDGWIGFIPILVSMLPYLYAFARVAVIGVFIKGFLSATKVKKNARMMESYVAVNGITP